MRKNAKNAKKYQKDKKHANCMFFAFFGGGFVRASNFSKIARNLGKMQKQCKKMRKNAKKMKKCEKKLQILEMCMFYKTKFQKLHFFAFLIAFFFAFFCTFLGHGFWGCTFWVHFFACFLHFYSSFTISRIS